MTLQERYDDAMFDYARDDYTAALAKLQAILAEEPAHFEAQLATAMCHYRLGDYAAAIAEGHKAERLQPNEQLVHTNLSLFYMKAGDKKTAEHHGLQARVASWRGNMEPPPPGAMAEPELKLAQPKPPPVKLPAQMPDMPWKKKPVTPITSPTSPSPASEPTPGDSGPAKTSN